MSLYFLAISLLLASAIFSGSEAALFTLASQSKKQKQASYVSSLLKDKAGALATILFANLVVNLSFFASAAGLARQASLSSEYQAILIHGGAVVLIVLFGEIAPKVWAHRKPHLAAWAFLPFVFALHYLGGGFFKRIVNFGPLRDLANKPLDAEATGKLLKQHGHEQLVENEQAMLEQLLELGELRAGALRRPLSRTLRVSQDEELSKALESILESGQTWAAVTKQSGDVTGILDLARLPHGKTVADAMQSVPILPEVAPMVNGIQMLLESGGPFVLLVDEYGDSVGVLERGRWADAVLDRIPSPSPGDMPPVIPLGSTRWFVDGLLPLQAFRDRFGDFGECDPRVDTLAGLFQERLGRLPELGDVLVLETDTGRRFQLKVSRLLETMHLLLELEEVEG